MTESESLALHVAGRLLAYPDQQFFATLPQLRAEAEEILRECPDDAFAREITCFVDALATLGQPASAAQYVAIFDHTPAASLHMTWHRYGNDRSQGRAMAALNGLYRSAGLEPQAHALPDYLPRMLEFMAVAPEWAVEILLDGFGPEIDALAASLEELESAHAPILKAALAPLKQQFPSHFKKRTGIDATRRPMAMPDPEPMEPIIPLQSIRQFEQGLPERKLER